MKEMHMLPAKFDERVGIKARAGSRNPGEWEQGPPIRMRDFALVAAMFACTALTGCGGGSPAAELNVRPEPRTVSATAAKPLRLPQDERFSIALAPSQKAPGLLGKADANSNARSDGTADASAKVENGGTASSSFQLGHVFSNDSERQVDLAVRVSFDFQYDATAQPPNVGEQAALKLDIFARDGRGRMLKTVNVLQYTTGEGDIAGRSRNQSDFSVPLGPRETLAVYAGGNASINAKDGRSGTGGIRISGLEMEVQSKPAPPIGAASQPASGS
ncbi:MAG: hypothetical protein HZB38_15725 [Planctomycetes bacterium]|nr:hypothetical protein [Planctomycetota bacterium]